MRLMCICTPYIYPLWLWLFLYSYEATTSRKSRSLTKELITGAVASVFLGFGSLFLLLASGVYVWLIPKFSHDIMKADMGMGCWKIFHFSFRIYGDMFCFLAYSRKTKWLIESLRISSLLRLSYLSMRDIGHFWCTPVMVAYINDKIVPVRFAC